MATIYEEVQKNISEWDHCVNECFGPSAQLLSVSRYAENRRVYRVNNRTVKIRKIVPESYERANDSAGEFKILLVLRGIKGICQNPTYQKEGNWELLSYDSAPGESLENLANAGKVFKTVPVKILRILWQVNLRGIAHRDITPENIIIDQNDEIHLIDFDQAIKTSRISAVFSDVLGIGKSSIIGFYKLENLFGRCLGESPIWLRLISITLKLIRKISSLIWKPRQALSVSKDTNENIDDPDLKLLKQAWEIAQYADANSPGGRIAYYSLDVAGHHFHGERSWTGRWSEISKKVYFQDKEIVECGCNLGLFSAFAHRAGAEKCVGVDWNNKILEGAHLVSKALHVANEFMRIDFDSPEKWEDKLTGFDMAIALSVVNWLKDRGRFLAFLGRHNEVIYEGHESVEIEINRLKKVGFKNIETIMVSERNRPVFYAQK